MSKIEEIRTLDNENVIVDLTLTKKELAWLKGNLDKMHLFSEGNLEHESRLIKRGEKESTKYFLLPKKLREGVSPSNCVKCEKIETPKANIFIFAVPKY